MKKKRKPTAKQRELQASWDALCKKWDTAPKFAHTKTAPPPRRSLADSYKLEVPAERDSRRFRSLDSMSGSTAPPPRREYTGTAIVGLATMHKSSIVPVFSKEQAIEVATMRRG